MCLNYWTPSPRAPAQQLEKPLQWKAHALWLESSPHPPQLEEILCRKEDPAQPKIDTQNYIEKELDASLQEKKARGTVASWWLSEVTHHSRLGSSQSGTSECLTPHWSLVYAEETKDLTKVSPLTGSSELPLSLYETESHDVLKQNQRKPSPSSLFWYFRAKGKVKGGKKKN